MTRLFCAALLFFLFSACASDAGNDEGNRKNGYTPELNNKEDSLFHEVMEGHDEAMAKMGKLAGDRKKIDQRIDSLAKAPQGANKKSIPELTSISSALREAENRMNDWMEKFNIDSAADNEEVRLPYLESEKSKVYQVRDDIFAALQKADSALEKP